MSRDLSQQIRERSEHALQCGALEPIATEQQLLEDSGVRFSVRLATALERKRTEAKRRSSPTNPFLPFDQELFVTQLGDHHVCLLNKFNVLEDHALIVTRAFAEQESLLDTTDFEALWECLSQIDGLAFYNSGPAAGASQRHKHLQLVPCPIGDGPGRVPMEALFLASESTDRGASVAASRLPFRHALSRLTECTRAGGPGVAREMHARYRALLAELDWAAQAPGAYNLLITRDWMLVVPRTRESSCGIEVNALGFAGALFARSPGQLDSLRALGPMQLLRDVTFPAA